MARVCVDSTYFETNDDGQLTIVPGSIGYQSSTLFTTVGNTNFFKSFLGTANWIYVEAVGGGGGGAGAESDGVNGVARGGGSGGTYSAGWVDVSTLPAIIVITVGAGGAGGVSNTPGGNGGVSSFGTNIIAPGGLGSLASSAETNSFLTERGALPGSTGTGQISIVGQPGGNAIQINSLYKISGFGGQSGWGGAGGRATANDDISQNGVSPYGGGGAGAASALVSQRTGGAGGNGSVRITVYR